MSRRKPRVLTIGTVLLVLAASTGVLSAALYGGFVPGFKYGVSTQSPTTTYLGYFSASYVGIYHYIRAARVCRASFPPCLAHDEVVFFLNAKNGTVRLLFYCGAAKEYCVSSDQLSFSEGACLHVKGTLIQPSKWPSNEFYPNMHFDGDVYVFESQTLTEDLCS
jgi:hypothetical protein